MKIGPVVSIIALDQLTKYIVTHNLRLNQSIPISSFFNITYIQNKGVLFGIMNNSSLSPFLVITANIIAITILILWSLRPENNLWIRAGITLIISGAVGNLIDRLLYGGVVDFLDFHIHQYHWPSFNVADISITIGTILLGIGLLKEKNVSRSI